MHLLSSFFGVVNARMNCLALQYQTSSGKGLEFLLVSFYSKFCRLTIKSLRSDMRQIGSLSLSEPRARSKKAVVVVKSCSKLTRLFVDVCRTNIGDQLFAFCQLNSFTSPRIKFGNWSRQIFPILKNRVDFHFLKDFWYL